MNIKKIIVIVVVIVLCILGVWFIPVKENTNVRIKETTQVLNDGYINILVDMGTYLPQDPHNEAIIEAAIRIADEINLFDFYPEKSDYAYVSNENIKKIVSELTGVTLTNPIILDSNEFYYPYHEDVDAYEIVPVATDWLSLSKVTNIEKEGNIYRLDCVAKTDAGDQYVDSVKIEVEYKPENEIIKYQINSITSTERYANPNNVPDVQ